MDAIRAVEAAASNDFGPMNSLVSRKFTLEDYGALFSYYVSTYDEQRKFFAISLLNSKLKGGAARYFALYIDVYSLYEPQNPTLLAVLGRFIYRVYKLSKMRLDLQSRNLLLSFMQYQQCVPEELLNLVSGLESPLALEVAKKITRQQLSCYEQVPAMIAHFATLLPRAHEVVLNLSQQTRAPLEPVFALLLGINEVAKFSYLKAVFDSRFLISQPETVYSLAARHGAELGICVQQLESVDFQQFYEFFADLLLVLANFERIPALLTQLMHVLSSPRISVVSPGSQQFWRSAVRYVQSNGLLESLASGVASWPLAAYLQCACNIYDDYARSVYAHDICLYAIAACARGYAALTHSLYACYLLSQMDLPLNEAQSCLCCEFIMTLIPHFREDINGLFHLNLSEYFDFTEVTPAGALRQLIVTLQHNFLPQSAVESFICNAFSIPVVPLYILVTYAAKSGFLAYIMLKIGKYEQFLVYCCVKSIEEELETAFSQIQFSGEVKLSDFQIVYIAQLFSNYYFSYALVSVMMSFLQREIKNDMLANLFLEAVSEVLPSLLYDSQNNILAVNMGRIVDFMLKYQLCEDYLRVVYELVCSAEEEQQLLPVIKPLLNASLLEYIRPYFATEQVIVRLCFDVLSALTRFGVDTMQTYIEILITYIETTQPDARLSASELASVLAWLPNESIANIITAALMEYQGQITEQTQEMLQYVLELENERLYKADALFAMLPRLKHILSY